MKRTLIITGILFAMLFSIQGNAERTVIMIRLFNSEKIEKRIFELMNKERTSRGLSALVYHNDLAELARIQSQNMNRHNFFSHTDHNGMGPQQRKVKHFPKLMGGIGENIAMHYGSTEEEIAVNLMTGWMNSPGHRANILREKYSYVGVGIEQKDAQYVYGTQVFGELTASLETEIPPKVPFGTDITLRFKFLGTFPKERLYVHTQFPDRSARFPMPDGSYYTGGGPLSPAWDGEHFTITLKLDKGKGRYTVMFGKDGSYYPDGVMIQVE